MNHFTGKKINLYVIFSSLWDFTTLGDIISEKQKFRRMIGDTDRYICQCNLVIISFKLNKVN